MGTEELIDQNVNPQSYSCIGRLENEYKDLSYDTLKDYLNSTIKSIVKHKKSKKFNDKNYQEEYKFLEKYVDNDIEHLKNLKKGFKDLCRYSDIKTYEYNSIEIKTEQKFINASPINVYTYNNLIATQGPKQNTIKDFWTMIDEYNCNIIIMLCKLKDNGKEKCAFYWDNNNLEKYTISLLSEEDKKFDKTFVIIRKINLINNETNVTKTITQLHYTEWPDYGVPDINKNFEVFHFMIEELDKLKGKDPGVVHCSAGVGRTGAFISIYYLFKEIIEQINNDNLNKINFSVFNLVRKLKEMRLYMVQNIQQYKFIYEFVKYTLKKYNI